MQIAYREPYLLLQPFTVYTPFASDDTSAQTFPPFLTATIQKIGVAVVISDFDYYNTSFNTSNTFSASI